MRKRILDRLMWIVMLLLFLAGATGCQTTSGSFCAIADPIRLSPQSVDALTDREVADILALNEKGAKLCGWAP